MFKTKGKVVVKPVLPSLNLENVVLPKLMYNVPYKNLRLWLISAIKN